MPSLIINFINFLFSLVILSFVYILISSPFVQFYSKYLISIVIIYVTIFDFMVCRHVFRRHPCHCHHIIVVVVVVVVLVVIVVVIVIFVVIVVIIVVVIIIIVVIVFFVVVIIVLVVVLLMLSSPSCLMYMFSS